MRLGTKLMENASSIESRKQPIEVIGCFCLINLQYKLKFLGVQ